MWCCSAVVKTIRKTSNSCFQVKRKEEKKVLLFGSTRFAPLLTFTFRSLPESRISWSVIVRCRDLVPVFVGSAALLSSVGLESCVCPPSRDGWTTHHLTAWALSCSAAVDAYCLSVPFGPQFLSQALAHTNSSVVLCRGSASCLQKDEIHVGG